MLGFGSKRAAGAVLIVDIGSGSVGMALSATGDAGKPETVWTHREFALMKDISSPQQALKLITTTLVNAFLEFGTNGQKALNNYKKGLAVTNIQVSISAPWAHTVAKTVTFSDEHPFDVTEDVIEELSNSAEKQSLEALNAHDLKASGLELITNQTINIKINGYNVSKIHDQPGRQVELSHIVSVAHASLMAVITESREKIVPRADIEIHSFMYVFYETLRSLHPDTSEICLVDITKEATEVGIVRDGVLRFTTHVPYGAFTLAREIADLCAIPKEEAYTVLKDDSQILEATLTEKRRDQLATILSAYDLKIASLFKETGDTLSIPKTIFLHTDLKTESFYKKHVLAGAKEATKAEHSVHVITSKLVPGDTLNDTGVALTTHFYYVRR